jgi:hypothetical protein
VTRGYTQIGVMFHIAIALLCVAPSSFAASRSGECHGILHWEKGSFQFGGGAGEGESICVIASSGQRKIMRKCSTGAFCRVRGTVKPCQDSGECVEIRRIERVQKN